MKEKLRYRSWSIAAKTLVSHVLLALFAIVFACVIAYALSYLFVQDTAIENLMGQVQYIAQSEVPEGDVIRYPEPEQLDVYQQLTGSSIFYINTEYVARHIPIRSTTRDEANLLHETSELSRTEIISAIDQQFLDRVFNGETVSAVRQFQFTSGVVLFAGTPLKNTANKIIGAVIIAQPISSLRELTGFLRFLLVVTAVVTVLLAVILALKMTQLLTRPIRRIIHAARRLSEGEYGTTIVPESPDEVGELAFTLNTLSAQLADTIARLREERDKLDLIITGIGEGIIAVDKDYNILHYNQAYLALMEIDSAPSLPVSDEESMRPLAEVIQECLSSGQRGHIIWENKSGRKIAAFASPMFSEKGRIIGAVCLLQDVSESERLEQLRREYVANISHELRTPLTGIRGMVEPLLDGYIETDEERQNCYEIIYHETRRLEKLVGDMLDMSRLQDGREKIEIEPLELPGILWAAIQRMQKMADEAGITLEMDTAGQTLACLGNEDRILQVLIIFMDNALSFTPAGGKIIVRAREDGECVRVSVRDTGGGIEAKDLPYIWERFYKADRSRMRTSGTGLGLAVAKSVVELMGGAVGVLSERGKGSEFFFTLKVR